MYEDQGPRLRDDEEERLAWQVTTRVANLEQQPWALHLLYPDWTVQAEQVLTPDDILQREVWSFSLTSSG